MAFGLSFNAVNLRKDQPYPPNQLDLRSMFLCRQRTKTKLHTDLAD